MDSHGFPVRKLAGKKNVISPILLEPCFRRSMYNFYLFVVDQIHLFSCAIFSGVCPLWAEVCWDFMRFLRFLTINLADSGRWKDHPAWSLISPPAVWHGANILAPRQPRSSHPQAPQRKKRTWATKVETSAINHHRPTKMGQKSSHDGHVIPHNRAIAAIANKHEAQLNTI